MKLTTQKKLAAKILKCSEKKVKVDKERLDEVKEAITKADVKSLIKDKAIIKSKSNEASRVRARKRQVQKRKGRSHGVGTRKGKKGARSPSKLEWMNKIRLQRKLLKELSDGEKITRTTYRSLYRKAGGGFFRSKRHLKLYITENELANKK